MQLVQNIHLVKERIHNTCAKTLTVEISNFKIIYLSFLYFHRFYTGAKYTFNKRADSQRVTKNLNWKNWNGFSN